MAEPWLDDPLGYLIGSGRAADFFDRIYEREALVAPHGEPKRFEGLFSIADVDRLVTSVDLREGQLDLADASRQMMRSDYVDAAGYVDRGAVADLHRGGATIILQQVHQLEPTLGRYCRALEHVFSAHVQTNLYLTPPNAQGFRTHYDNHDVFVIQIEGEKAWRLYEKPIDTPYRGEEFQAGKFEPGEVKQEFLLKAGDCAYVPRGLMHDAMTSGDTPSLHVTVGLITRTWADLMLEAVSEAALRLPALRRSLPAGYARADFDRTGARAHVRELAQAVAREIHPDPAFDLLVDTFIRSRGADNASAVAEASRPIRLQDRFARRPFAQFRIAEDGDRIALIAPGGELDFDNAARPALERALDGSPFTPGDVGGETGIAMTGKLLAYGLIARA
jgi:mannose-6-phosphate isomerase-like protein (cupin superfamily)